MHPWLPNSPSGVRERLLRSIGVERVDELFRDIPESIVLGRLLNVGFGRPLSEPEVARLVDRLLSRNRVFHDPPPFMGGGVCAHHVPSLVAEVVRRSEFYTAYTPYQAEISQGLLQALFEYQSLMADLVEMDVVNASMYDMSTAVAEAFLMAARVTGRARILVPATMNPQHYEVARTVVEAKGIRMERIGYDGETGMMDLDDLASKLASDVAAVYVENPGYLGFFEENVEAVADAAHGKGALLIAGFEPLSLGIVKPPGAYGADIAVAEGQPLGLGLNYGGPLLGVFAVRWERRLVRQMPGRLIGLTESRGGERGFAMILQTREQHIRREKATSNITTNEALAAIAAAVYLSLLGRAGIVRLAETIALRARYAAKRLSEIPGVEAPALDSRHFKEFTARFPCNYRELHKHLLEKGILGGHYIGSQFPWLGEAALFCVTEVHSKGDIDMLAEKVAEYVGGGA